MEMMIFFSFLFKVCQLLRTKKKKVTMLDFFFSLFSFSYINNSFFFYKYLFINNI